MRPVIEADTRAAVGLLDEVADRAEDMSGALELVADDFIEVTEAVFASRGMLAGGWQPLDPDWAAYKAEIGGGPPGEFTGLLRSALTSRHGNYSVRRIGTDRAVLGTNVPHAHLFNRGRGGQPPRPLIPPAAWLAARWAPMVGAYLSAGRDSRVARGLL